MQPLSFPSQHDTHTEKFSIPCSLNVSILGMKTCVGAFCERAPRNGCLHPRCFMSFFMEVDIRWVFSLGTANIAFPTSEIRVWPEMGETLRKGKTWPVRLREVKLEPLRYIKILVILSVC